jgi:hypothetical protein
MTGASSATGDRARGPAHSEWQGNRVNDFGPSHGTAFEAVGDVRCQTRPSVIVHSTQVRVMRVQNAHTRPKRANRIRRLFLHPIPLQRVADTLPAVLRTLYVACTVELFACPRAATGTCRSPFLSVSADAVGGHRILKAKSFSGANGICRSKARIALGLFRASKRFDDKGGWSCLTKARLVQSRWRRRCV